MKTTTSSGGIVVNNGRILVVNQNGNSWSLPKGHIDPGETALETAIREIKEESGISQLELVKELGSYERYKIGKDPETDDMSELKVINMFLFTTNQEELNPEDPNNPEARWVDKDEVASLLTHKKDKEFLTKNLLSL